MSQLAALIPEKKWIAWIPLSRQERLLQAMAYVCDALKPRETDGNNRGKMVDALTEDAGYEKGLPWCAISITACALAAGYKRSELPSGPGAVINWKRWAEVKGFLTNAPRRGDLCLWLNRDGTGHIGIVVKCNALAVWSIEGNTSSGEAGSQRDGDGMFRRIRARWTWKYFLRMPV